MPLRALDPEGGGHLRSCVSHCVFLCLFVEWQRTYVKRCVSLNVAPLLCVFALSVTLTVTASSPTTTELMATAKGHTRLPFGGLRD